MMITKGLALCEEFTDGGDSIPKAHFITEKKYENKTKWWMIPIQCQLFLFYKRSI